MPPSPAASPPTGTSACSSDPHGPMRAMPPSPVASPPAGTSACSSDPAPAESSASAAIDLDGSILLASEMEKKRLCWPPCVVKMVATGESLQKSHRINNAS